MDISIVTQSDETFRIIKTIFGNRTILPEESNSVKNEIVDETPIKNKVKITEDEIKAIDVKKFGEAYLAKQGDRVAIGVTEEDAVKAIEDMTPPVTPSGPIPTPLENSKKGHPFDFFGGTSWAGKSQGFN